MSDDLIRRSPASGARVWWDGVTRDHVRSGLLQALVDDRGVSGVVLGAHTLAKSLAGGAPAYADDLVHLAATGVGRAVAARLLAAGDAREACDALRELHRESGGRRGWAGVEADPRFVHDAGGTLSDVRALARRVDRPNLVVRIPATRAGVRAIADATAAGYSTDATLVCSAERYVEVRRAHALGLARARGADIDVSAIHTVVSIGVAPTDLTLDATGSSAIPWAALDAVAANPRQPDDEVERLSKLRRILLAIVDQRLTDARTTSLPGAVRTGALTARRACRPAPGRRRGR